MTKNYRRGRNSNNAKKRRGYRDEEFDSIRNKELICQISVLSLYSQKSIVATNASYKLRLNNKFQKRFKKFHVVLNPFPPEHERSLSQRGKLSIYLRTFEYFILTSQKPEILARKAWRDSVRHFSRGKGKLSAQTIRASVRSVRDETLSSARLLRVHRSALSDNRIRTSRIKRGILLKLARQLLHFDPLFFSFARAA